MTLVDESGAPRGERYFAIYNPPVVNRQLGIRKSALGCGARRGAVVPEQGAADDRVRAVAARHRGARHVPQGGARDAAGLRGRRSAATAAATCRSSGARSSAGCARGRCSASSRRTRSSSGSTSAASTRPCSSAIRAASPRPGSRPGARGAARAPRWRCWSRTRRRSTSSSPRTPTTSSARRSKQAPHQSRQPADPGQPRQVRGLRAAVRGATRRFGSENLAEILGFLEEQRLLHRAGERWHWTSESYPADAVSLRSVSSDNFVVQDITREPRIIAEVDFDRAPSMVHEKAIYILEGRTYFVEKYDHKERRAHVREAEVDYYTDAITYTKVQILDRFAEEARGARPAQPRRGARHLAGRGLQEDQVPHQRERRLGRAADARERDAHHRRTGSRCRAS